MFELIFLGTSASAPSVHRGLSSAVVLHREHRFMIDCGEGTQRQILKSGLGFKRLDRILITHGHLDHILGLGGLASTLGRWEAIEELNIYSGRWALERVAALMRVVFGPREMPFAVHLNQLHPGILMEDDHFSLSAFSVSHRGPDCFGFAFREKERRPFLPDKAEALGVPVGPERRELVAGCPITLESGRAIHPDEVLGPPVRGASLVFVGDAGRTDDLLEVCHQADALVIEATYLQEEAKLAADFGHITATQAATLAREAGVKQLVLTHISRRYRPLQVLREAEAIFPDTIVANDFDRFRVVKDGPVQWERGPRCIMRQE